jgi:hypothetical protein
MAGHWLFVCNPGRWDIWSYLADGKGLRKVGWSLARFADEIETGDDAALWITGEFRGVYAIGRVTSEVFTSVGDEEYWTDSADAAKERKYVFLDLGRGLVGDPILEPELLEDGRFKDADVLRHRKATPHRLTGEQWLAIAESRP